MNTETEGYDVHSTSMSAPSPPSSNSVVTTSSSPSNDLTASLADAQSDDAPPPASPPAPEFTTTPFPPPAVEGAAPPSSPTPPAPLAPTPLPDHLDPKVKQLHALFPTTDVEIIEAVLASTGENVDQAIQTLLEVSDPDYKVDNVEQLSQLEADEELARALAREDELHQAHHRVNTSHRSSSTAQPQQSNHPLAYQPYVPKSRRTPAATPASPSASSWTPPTEQEYEHSQGQRAGQGQYRYQEEPEKDELDQLTEQFSKFADQGKKMFGSFLSKAKEQVAKIDESIQRSGSPSTGSSQAPAPPPKLDHRDSWQIPSPLPRPSVHSPSRQSTSSSMPDFSAPPPASSSALRSQTPSPSLDKPLPSTTNPTSTSTSVPAAATSPAPAATTKPTFSVPGLLPRQSFSLLDTPSPKSSPVKSPLAAPAAVGAATGVLAGSGTALVAGEKKEESHYSLGDDESGSEDEMEYVRSPFQDDD